MAAFDFDATRRWVRFDPGRTLSRRSDNELPFISGRAEAGNALLLDTCVIIDQMQGQAPQAVEDLIEIRQVNHSTVAIQELMHTVGVLDPGHPGTENVIRQIGHAIKAMPPHRLFAPDPDVLGKAAVLAGMLCRLQGYGKDHRLRLMQDAVLFLQAQKLGFTVLTGNVGDFDLLLQMMPSSRVLMYRSRSR